MGLRGPATLVAVDLRRWFRSRGRSDDASGRSAAKRRVVRGPHDDPNLSDDELVAQRTEWFEAYTAQLNVFAPRSDALYSCPCCGHPTLTERGAYEICRRCGWEDDGQDDHDSSVVRGGPNGRLSLDAARAEYDQLGSKRLPHTPPSKPR